MNLNFLQCFVTLSETLNFTQAAKQLAITQPSVSRQIKLLEEQLGFQLFIRDKHRVSLSPEGKEFKNNLVPIVEEFRNVLTRSRERSQSVKGNLSFGCYPEIGQYFFMENLLLFQEKYPEVELNISYSLEPEILEGIRSGELDFGVVNRPIVSENIRTYRLLEERSVLVTRKKNPTTLREDSKPLFLGYNRNDPLLNAYLRKHIESDLRKNARFSSVNSHNSMLDFLLSKDSYAVLPYFSVKKLLKQGKLRLESEQEIVNTFYLIYFDTQIVPKRVEVFRKFLIERCRNTLLEDSEKRKPSASSSLPKASAPPPA